jgi:phytoene dehydrogenase-like protein
MSRDPHVVVVGAGPNGLAAAIVLARAGLRVSVFERAETVGGGVRSAELTRPGFVHDICSAIHAFAGSSPVFQSLPLAAHGLEWIQPAAALAHPLDDGTAVVVETSIDRTAASVDRADQRTYRSLMQPVVDDWESLVPVILGPLRLPRHPFIAARFGLTALRSAQHIARRFSGSRARALVAGVAAHGMLPLDAAPTAGVFLTLTALAHTSGWMYPRGGAQRLADAMAAYLRSLGADIHTDSPVANLDDLPSARAVLCDLSPKPFLEIAGHRLPASYRQALARFRYGPGVFKVDWALNGPVPWTAADCARAPTLHLGGTFEEIAASESATARGEHVDRPFVLLVQPSVLDPTRAPVGCQTLWTYCHVPSGSTVDMTSKIEAQIERFAPGFRDRVIARVSTNTHEFEARNPNLVGGDIGMGASTLSQLFARPTWREYSTGTPGLYLCSASTPPGVGVHGMCGAHAAARALRQVFGAG